MQRPQPSRHQADTKETHATETTHTRRADRGPATPLRAHRAGAARAGVRRATRHHRPSPGVASVGAGSAGAAGSASQRVSSPDSGAGVSACASSASRATIAWYSASAAAFSAGVRRITISSSYGVCKNCDPAAQRRHRAHSSSNAFRRALCGGTGWAAARRLQKTGPACERLDGRWAIWAGKSCDMAHLRVGCGGDGGGTHRHVNGGAAGGVPGPIGIGDADPGDVSAQGLAGYESISCALHRWAHSIRHLPALCGKLRDERGGAVACCCQPDGTAPVRGEVVGKFHGRHSKAMLALQSSIGCCDFRFGK